MFASLKEISQRIQDIYVNLSPSRMQSPAKKRVYDAYLNFGTFLPNIGISKKLSTKSAVIGTQLVNTEYPPTSVSGYWKSKFLRPKLSV